MEGKHVGSFAADVEGTGEGRCAEGEGEGSAGTDRDLGLWASYTPKQLTKLHTEAAFPIFYWEMFDFNIIIVVFYFHGVVDFFLNSSSGARNFHKSSFD